MPLRVCAYNVRYSGVDSGTHVWERRRDGVAAAVARLAPDVVCLQEVWRGQLADLRERLPGFAFHGRRAAGGEHTPIGHDPERFVLDDWDAFALSETPDDLAQPGWDASLPRVTTWVRLRDRDGAGTLTVVSTHFDHEGERARRESASLLADWVRDGSGPVVVAGDLNCEPGDPPHDTLAGPGGPLQDAREGFADDAEPTFTHFGGPEGGRRLDHVLVTPDLAVESFAIDVEAGFSSDHYPVVATVARRA